MKDKVKTLQKLKISIADIRKKGQKVVFTNGCFDILHVGHVRYLADAKARGDCLIVAINSDESIRGLKGNKRPIVSQNERAEVLASLESVDFVTTFNEPDPFNVINELQPDYLVKGGDWGEDEIIGSDIVLERGGEVIRIPFIEGASSTNIMETIIERYCGSRELI